MSMKENDCAYAIGQRAEPSRCEARVWQKGNHASHFAWNFGLAFQLLGEVDMSAKSLGMFLAFFGVACSSGEEFQGVPSTDASSETSEGGRTTCNIDAPIVHGIRPDGRVDVSAAEAWPNRPPEPSLVTPSELLGGCAILSACFFRLQTPDGGIVDLDKQMADAVRSCVNPASHGNEERVIPEFDQNERWSFNLRTLLANKGCGGLFKSTQRPAGIICEEDGCWWNPALAPPSVTCSGDIATLAVPGNSFTRDCSHSFTKCSDTSLTGCTDRAPVTCQSAANDRCDGDIKLGCDRCGMVSFHDCGLMGGHCVENSGGAACVYPNAGLCTPENQSCEGNLLTSCVGGTPVTIDCVALGLTGCSNAHCFAP